MMKEPKSDMLKSVVCCLCVLLCLCVLVWHEMGERSRRAERCQTDTPTLNFSAVVSPKIDDMFVQRIDPYTVHHDLRTWSEARQICVNQGDVLVDIKSRSEEKIMMKMISDYSLETLWIGFQDQPGTDDWMTGFDEPLRVKKFVNWLNYLKRTKFGIPYTRACVFLQSTEMNIDDCDTPRRFVCKTTII